MVHIKSKQHTEDSIKSVLNIIKMLTDVHVVIKCLNFEKAVTHG